MARERKGDLGRRLRVSKAGLSSYFYVQGKYPGPDLLKAAPGNLTLKPARLHSGLLPCLTLSGVPQASAPTP